MNSKPFANFLGLLLCLTGCKALDKKIVEMSSATSEFRDTNSTPECYRRLVPMQREIGFQKMSSAQPAAVIQVPPITRSTTNITLGWTASTSPDAGGYNIYWGLSPGEYPNEIQVGNVTNATVGNLAVGYTYYFTASTVDEDTYEGPLADEINLSPPLVLEIHFPDPGTELQSTVDLVNWSTRDAAFDGNVYRVTDPKWPMEFYRTTTTK